MSASGRFTAVVIFAAVVSPLCAQRPSSAAQQRSAESARDLVREVIYNELHDRERDSHWEYRSECVSAAENLVREQVETDNGPVFRVLAEHGAPLDDAQQQREEQRLDRYIHDPGEIARVRHAHEEDEARLAGVMELLPKAFVFEYQGGEYQNGEYRNAPADELVHIAFRPDPQFSPSSYEARIVHALAGRLTVDTRLKRMIDMHGVLAERVDFGYGFLGHVDKGGSFEIHRVRVSAAHWKTDLVEVHIQGKVLMLKTVSKDQREARSDFRSVPSGTTLAEAKQMLSQASDQRVQARLVPAAVRK